jgi:hypothetical protein
MCGAVGKEEAVIGGRRGSEEKRIRREAGGDVPTIQQSLRAWVARRRLPEMALRERETGYGRRGGI